MIFRTNEDQISKRSGENNIKDAPNFSNTEKTEEIDENITAENTPIIKKKDAKIDNGK